MKVGFAITSSFCTLNQVLVQVASLKSVGYDIYPIVSENIVKYDTRFGKSSDFINKLEEITGHKIASNIVEADIQMTNVPNNAFSQMFEGCSNLRSINYRPTTLGP